MSASNSQLTGRESRRSAFLNRAIPLDCASHADVVNYSIDIPMRYTECFATLADGRIARFLDSRQLIGWSDTNGRRSYLFRRGFRRIEIQTDAGVAAGHGRSADEIEVFSWPSLIIGSKDLLIQQRDKSRARGTSHERKFIARDGSLLLIHGWVRSLARRIGVRRPRSHAIDGCALADMTGDAQA